MQKRGWNAGWPALVGVAVVAAITGCSGTAANAALFSSGAPKTDASSIVFASAPGVFSGKWAYRSIGISGDTKATLARLSLGDSEFELSEDHGKITGTRPAGKGQTYPVTGFAVYGDRKAPEIVLHSTAVVKGKSYEFDYFAYLMPHWKVSADQPDTFMGTVVRTDPVAPGAPAVVASFIATREPAANGK